MPSSDEQAMRTVGEPCYVAGYVTRTSQNNSPGALPEITDSEQPSAHEYANESVFWNSTLIQASSDLGVPCTYKEQSSVIGLQNVTRAARANSRRCAPGPLSSICEEIRRSPPRKRTKAQEHAHSESDDDMERSTGKDDNDLTVMLSLIPDLIPAHQILALPPREPIAPHTQEWDTFMDFPSDNSIHLYQNNNGQQDLAINERHAPIALHTSSLDGETITDQQRDTDMTNNNSRARSHTAVPEYSECEQLTWNLILNRVLQHDSIDPTIKQAVHERAQVSSSTNGTSHGGHKFVSAREVGLVPNFSYPMVGSAFYEKGTVTQQQTISNGCEDASLRDNTEQNPYNPISIESRSPVHNTLRRSATPLYILPAHVHQLLSSVLTSSELALHKHILNHPNTAMFSSSPANQENRGMPLTTLHTRLILALHILIIGLQDRTTHLEDTLVPQLSTWLEQKTYTNDQLRFELHKYEAKISNLTEIVDFGNKLLGGCWQRTWEVWRTLIDIRMQRDEDRGSFLRLLSRRWGQSKRNAIHMPQAVFPRNEDPNILAGESMRTKLIGSQGPLSSRELDALILVAQQNIDILREHMEEMRDMVQDHMRGITGISYGVSSSALSWRDV